MPVHKEDADRALELLEKYHEKLTKPQDRALRGAIERVIRIFQSRLFLALLDIQEFYEATLLDGNKSQQQKAYETLEAAHKWENQPVDSEQGNVSQLSYSNAKVIATPRDERPSESLESEPNQYTVPFSNQIQVQQNGMEAD